MNENVKLSCACDEGCSKGALRKTIENSIFTIFGNLVENNTIVVRYHGHLTDDSKDNTFHIFFYFDFEEKKEELQLTRCSKCAGECYCTLIDLNNYSKIRFGFMDSHGNIEQNNDKLFELDIIKDPISKIMQRYGFEENTKLPLVSDECHKETGLFKTIIKHILSFFNSFKKETLK